MIRVINFASAISLQQYRARNFASADLRIRSRVLRWYAQLRQVENDLGERSTHDKLTELNDIHAHVGQITVPLSHADALYELRSHIHWVRRRLQGAATVVDLQTAAQQSP